MTTPIEEAEAMARAIVGTFQKAGYKPDDFTDILISIIVMAMFADPATQTPTGVANYMAELMRRAILGYCDLSRMNVNEVKIGVEDQADLYDGGKLQ